MNKLDETQNEAKLNSTKTNDKTIWVEICVEGL